MSSHSIHSSQLCPTGISGLDDIVGGGLLRYRMYLVEGLSGGKSRKRAA